ncbi:hypothetical protein RRSWK_00993 [Rhodopirellula sp. SWK7]|nr:hypothetical protein RRSWK_00993 [Rhodopirellula sp. SWK7]
MSTLASCSKRIPCSRVATCKRELQIHQNDASIEIRGVENGSQSYVPKRKEVDR